MDIYVQKDGQQQGPFSEFRIREGIDTGEFTPADLAWMNGKASWQPLSALLDLDTTKPPPIPSSSFPVPPAVPSVPAQPIFFAPVQTPPPLPVTNHATPAPAQQGGRACRKCGAAYKPWSLNRAMGSGLCVACSQAAAKQNSEPITSRPIRSRDDALKVLRYTGILYIIAILIDVAIGVLWDSAFLGSALLLSVCALALCLGHSRIAGIVLLIILVGGVTLDAMDRGLNAFQPPWIWLTCYQFVITLKATFAVFKLNGELKQQSAA